MTRQILRDNWTVRTVGDPADVPVALRRAAVPATVPGCVHTDLIRAGKIDDPYRDLNEFKTRWIGHTDWEYRTTFDADGKLFDHERIDLVCDGLDTVATIVLNGSEVARTQNMHRGYRFDVRSLLLRGPNELVITFASPVKYAEAMREKLKPRPYVNGPGGPFNFIRKMACNFGWDWGPALPTSGIWRPIRLEGWSQARVVNVRHQLVSIDHERDTALVRFDVDVEFAGGPPKPAVFPHNPKLLAILEVFHEGQDPSDNAKAVRDVWQAWVEENRVSVDAEVTSPRLWWPRGHGEQPLRDMKLVLAARDGSLLDEYRARIGLRTVELDTSPDDIGARFVVKVNGKPIFCKGFNWIPDDCFLDRACEPARVRQRIGQAVDAGANMLRVWGGGIYETDEFYDICDELGVLVWQDFPFACAMYPEEEPFKSEVEAEARYNVARLAHHPSLAIWNGCNENIWAYRDWGWKDSDEVKGRTWGLGYYLDLLPRVVKELTPSIPYWAASPWSGDPDPDNGIHPNADTHGNMHVWRPWFHEDYASYRNFNARFCSEFGFQGPATYGSIASVVPPEARDFGSPQMRHRQKSGDRVRDDGDRRNLRHLIRYFNLPAAQELLDALDSPDPNAKVPYCGAEPVHPANTLPSRVNFDDLHYLLQVNQARALTLGVEWFRSRQPRCMGTLYWQLNDCWPGSTSWSCIDGDGRPKLLWYATRRFFSPRILTIQPELEGSLGLYASNDFDETWSAEVALRRIDFTGAERAAATMRIDAPPRTTARVGLLPESIAQTPNPQRELIVAQTGMCRATWFFRPDKELNYPPAEFESTLDRYANAYVLAIKPRVLLRDLVLQVDRLDPAARVGDNLLTVLPNESVAVTIWSEHQLTKEPLTSPPVLRCVNPFGRSA